MIKDTFKVQLASLDLFMNRLCYFREGGRYCNSLVRVYGEYPYLSLRTAVQLHNGNVTPFTGQKHWHGKVEAEGALSLILRSSPITVKDAYENRLVKTVKLQYSKKQKKVICQSHLIEINSENIPWEEE